MSNQLIEQERLEAQARFKANANVLAGLCFVMQLEETTGIPVLNPEVKPILEDWRHDNLGKLATAYSLNHLVEVVKFPETLDFVDWHQEFEATKQVTTDLIDRLQPITVGE